MSGDITKITQACIAAQENTGKLTENVISEALTKPQDITPPNQTVDSRSNQMSNSSHETNWTSSSPTTNFGMPQHQIMTHNTHRDLMRHLHLPMLI